MTEVRVAPDRTRWGDVGNTTTEYLQPKRGSFDGDGKQWSFHRGREIIYAKSKDEAFLERYRRGLVRMHHTDVLRPEPQHTRLPSPA